ncbi:hypothetical protein GCM10007159_42180 [Modicisalibacter luteus]|nr:hypothetical protein GCM10007159_42180 [Halomonas lutea]
MPNRHHSTMQEEERKPQAYLAELEDEFIADREAHGKSRFRLVEERNPNPLSSRLMIPPLAMAIW